MYVLMDAAAAGSSFPTSFVAVYVIGFIAAVTIGSIAWYNSKRPVGWENKERPDVVPKVDKSDSPGVGDSKN
ncbi:MAG: photosystem II assembly protein Psb35 [Cyanophyceae cyanobacterium]